MSAFGQAGFGSMNRRNQLRAQGQLDPYGQQVRAAKQVPTLSIYQTQGTQQATGQQQAQTQSQPAQQPAAPAAQPSAPAMPAYSPSYSAGAAQPIAPQTQGTPYQQSAGQAGGAVSPQDYRHLRGILPQNVDPAQWDEYAKGGAFGQAELDWINQRRMIEAEHLRLNALRGHPGDQGEALWRQQQEVERTVRQQKEPLGRFSPGTAQPIQPQSQGTPYGADPGYAGRVAAAEQQWSSTPAGSQKRDWEGNTVRNMLARGLPPSMGANVLQTNSTRYGGDPAGASQFANQTEQNRIASLSSGPPQAPGPNATASEVSAYLNASDAYGRQQQAQQARDERIAAEAAFNDPARTAGGPSQSYINAVRRQQMNQGGSALMNPFAYRSQLQSGAIDVFGNQVTSSTPNWAMYNY